MKFITPVRQPPGASLTGQVYHHIRQEFGVVADPFRLHAPVPVLLAAIWSATREIGVAQQVPWPVKEAIAAAVSQSNQCPYCVEIHGAVASVLSDQPLAPLLMHERTADIADPTLRGIVTWAQATRTAGSAAVLHPPCTASTAPEIIGTAITYHYINRLVQIFLPASLLPALFHQGWPGSVAWRLIARKLARSREHVRVAGSSLRFVPAADLPSEFSWAAASPTISRALAGWAAVIDGIGAGLLTPQVRATVIGFLHTWQGEQMPLSRSWVNTAIAQLPDADQAVGTLALLTAVAPHQIDAEIVGTFRLHQPTDAQFVGVTAWASFQAARRIASWLRAPAETEQGDHLQHTLGQPAV